MLYKARWQMKMVFSGSSSAFESGGSAASGNAVKSQTWTVVSVYALIAIVKKRPKVEASRYTLLQIFSFTHFEKMPIR